MLPTIINRRYGFATNSSSSHSIVFLPDNSSHSDYNSSQNQEFGWEDFLLTSREAKLPYIAQLLGLAWDELYEEKYNFKRSESGYIDHESADVPCDPSHYDAFVELMLNDKIAVSGGNDNDDSDRYNFKDVDLNMLFANNIIRRWDNDVLVAFDPYNGKKCRFNFGNGKYALSSVPELVDIKITDYCAYACEYCYQDSTRDGKHGDLDFIKSTIDKLADAKVFELALGGGETTQHPDFIEILHYAFMKGIVPNFTTRNLAWLNNESKRTQIFKFIGAFAFSADTVDDVKRLIKIMLTLPWSARTKFSVQIVMGTVSRDNFTEIVNLCNDSYLRLTLLGYKTTGRGDQVQPIDYSWWLDDLNSVRNASYINTLSVGIDTELALQFKAELDANGVDQTLYTLTEGTHSCYIDAVAKLIAPSSYEADEASYTPFTDNWKETYQTFASAKANYIDIINL